MKERIPKFLTTKHEPAVGQGLLTKGRISFVSNGMEHVASILRTMFIQWETSSMRGFFQGIDARMKVLFLILFIILVSLKKTILSQVVIGFFLFGLAAASKINLLGHYRKILILTFIFGFLMALPSAFNVITHGKVILPVLQFEKVREVGDLTIPQEIGITGEGIKQVAMLSLRVMNSLSITLLVFATTPFMEFIKALKILRVPDIFLMTIALTYKYIFIFSNIVYDMYMAKKSRLCGPERDIEVRRWVAGRIAFLYHKSMQRCGDVLKAMTARGLSDSIRLYRMPPLTLKDWLAGAIIFVGGIILYGI